MLSTFYTQNHTVSTICTLKYSVGCIIGNTFLQQQLGNSRYRKMDGVKSKNSWRRTRCNLLQHWEMGETKPYSNSHAEEAEKLKRKV